MGLFGERNATRLFVARETERTALLELRVLRRVFTILLAKAIALELFAAMVGRIEIRLTRLNSAFAAEPDHHRCFISASRHREKVSRRSIPTDENLAKLH